MDLSQIRKDIDGLDGQILELFIKRMELCRQVARYKIDNDLPVMQGGREKEIIDKVMKASPDSLADASKVLFTSIMDISKCLQAEEFTRDKIYDTPKTFDPSKAEVIACQGSSGAYSEAACIKLFGENKPIRFMTNFKDVVGLVESGRADHGLLPLENSTVGSIAETYDLMASHDFYINNIVRVEITHCLAAKAGTRAEDIRRVFSKKEALAQCSQYLKKHQLEEVEFSNTALAAEMVKNSTDSTIACICSKRCAEMNGLEIIEEHAADAYPNYTRFICFSKDFAVPQNADTISVAFAVPHISGGLYRMLTKFAVNGLNLKKIVNKQVAGTDFEAVIFLDFDGNYTDRKVAVILDDLRANTDYFRFLGNFSETV
ncbi:MAG: bifunctional chorismate mutase/prephenate dehydratase [Huintestinicola sp.]